MEIEISRFSTFRCLDVSLQYLTEAVVWPNAADGRYVVNRAKGLLTFDMNEVHVALQEVQANHGSPGDLRKTFLICLKHCTFDTKVMSSSALYFFILFLPP